MTVPGFDVARAEGPGLLQLAVNERRGRVYLFSPKQLSLFVYDRSLALLRTTVLPQEATAAAGSMLDGVTSDDANDRLFLLSMILDAEGEQVTGSLPDGDRVVALYPEGDRIFAAKAVARSSPAAADGHDRLVEIRAPTLEVLDVRFVAVRCGEDDVGLRFRARPRFRGLLRYGGHRRHAHRCRAEGKRSRLVAPLGISNGIARPCGGIAW